LSRDLAVPAPEILHISFQDALPEAMYYKKILDPWEESFFGQQKAATLSRGNSLFPLPRQQVNRALHGRDIRDIEEII
jgi:hypothetical protein